MRTIALTLAAVIAAPTPARAPLQDAARWERQAQNITIIRDDWGIAHVYGKTDADAVFGMIYAQAEDDFNRVETNYLNALGRLAEAEGESAIYQDLRMKLFINPDSLRVKYAASPVWLKHLMNAWADGLNFYLSKHPEVKPRVITRFEPWMALSFTEGSIGGDIERVNLRDLQAFYESGAASPTSTGSDEDDPLAEPTGSNGIAIAPANTRNHHALLWINPHTSFYFRSELQMVSDEGLNAYGAVTWGQIFIYQGFNATAGWMHTSSGVDNIDEFLETVTERGGRYFYRHGVAEAPVRVRRITVPYRTDAGLARKTFTVFYTRHGPVVRKTGERWVSISLMQSPVNALIQSYSRTKAKDYAAFTRVMDLHTNSSNNTLFADASGNIAYFHSNYIPRRDTTFDWSKPVDGSNPATDYRGVLAFSETPNVVNPPIGWVYNSNNWPWSAAGPESPRRERFPRYVENGAEETPRGYHALRVLTGRKDFTMDELRAAAFDSYLPAFERLIPALLRAYDQGADSVKSRFAEQAAMLRAWDYRWSTASVPTSLAVYWGQEALRRLAPAARAAGVSAITYADRAEAAADLLAALGAACDSLGADFGSWKTPWGEINRFQRINDDIAPRFDDAGPSTPVPFTSAAWGSLASFGARSYANTKKMYGSSGNSFVAVVEFGDSVRARAVTAGGESGDPRSPHFNDQAERYASGNLRDVYFYRSQLVGHTEREYHPGH
ncbi:MAG TPA: penicillin acylase family protein [Gemmatimonadales bacterium]|jgi:acyl-homoserine lactone acylase PvdQ|nr:penicillin acylase family protein [Gemmatimonadales bacterium]